MPAAALVDFEPEADQRIDFEPEADASLGTATAPIELPREKRSADGGLFHRAMNDVREFGSSAGKFIFHGLEGLSLEQAKILANPPSELYATSAEETLLPQGQQLVLEAQRKTAARERVQPALDSAAHWWQRAAELDAESNVDPHLAQTWDARLSRAGGAAAVMGAEAIIPVAGLPIMALNGAVAAEAEARNSGKTNEQAEGAAVRSLIGLAIFGGANKIAALGVAKLLPNGSKTLTKFVAQFVGQDAANELSSRAIGAWEAAADAKPGDKVSEALKALTNTTLESSTLNAVYAGIGAAHEAGRAKPIRPDTIVDFVPESDHIATEFARVEPAAVAAANEEGLRAIRAEAEKPPTVEQLPPDLPAETQTDVSGFPVRPVSTDQIAARPELMQFKQIDNRATGENASDQITAPYDPIKAGNLLLWEPINPNEYGLEPPQRYIVANGHHRDAAAKEQSVTTQNAQIIRESAGLSAGDARSLAAEANIADGKGTIYDQAKFIRNEAATHGADAALARAGQIGARGRNATTIALASRPDLFASFVNEQITPEQTRAIAEAAPGNEGLQRLGIKRAASGDQPNDIANFLQAVQARGPRIETATQADLFGADDAAIRHAELMAKHAGAIQREIGDQISSVSGAAKRPEKAAALGVDVKNPAAVQFRLAQLQALRDRARNWSIDDQIRNLVSHGEQPPAEVVRMLQNSSELSQTPQLRTGEKTTGELFQGTDQPFNLAGEVGSDFAARQAEIERDARASAEAAGVQEQSQTKLFGDESARAEEFQGDYGGATQLRRPGSETQSRASIATDPADVSLRTLASAFEQRNEFLVDNRKKLAKEIQRAASDAALAQARITTREGRDYARELITDYANFARNGVIPQRSRLPIYRPNYERYKAQYQLAAQHAQKAVTESLIRLGFTPQTHIFASGSATPRQKPAGTTGAQPQGISTPPAQNVLVPIRSWWQTKTLGVRKLIAPQTIDATALRVANIIRDYNGQNAIHLARADSELSGWRASFDRTPVPQNWRYDPGKPLPRNYAFMAESEAGGANLTPNERELKAQFGRMFQEVVDEVHRVKPTALRSLIQDYFPHIWQDPAEAQRVFAAIIGDRSLEGSKAFLRQRVLAYIEDGLKHGLRPISDNPIDIILTKLHEVRKFVAAQDILREAKEIGARKFVYAFEKPPEGWVKVDDPTSTVHGPPFVTLPEAFDEQMRVKTVELLDRLGISHERVTRLGGKRWGTYETGGTGIRSRFAGPLSVYWHELGHGLQERYGWIDSILPGVALAGKSPLAVELRALADLRFEGQTPSKSFQKYIRTKDEKAAVMLEAYVHAPDRMKAVAPTIFARVRSFIADRPELHPIEEIRPSLVIGSSKQQVPVGGMVTLGHYYMPEGASAVLKNYLSPGLQRFGIIRNLRSASNILNAAQLGMSAFHAGFTSIDATVSTWALGLQYVSRGQFAKGFGRIAASPLSPLTNYYTGKAVQAEMLRPGSGEVRILGLRHQLSPEGQARVQEIAQLAVRAGLRATIDPFWKTQITRNMVRAFHEGGVKGYSATILRAPFAIVEQLMRPILEFLVPRQKLGVFAGLAKSGMDRLGPNADIYAVREAMARAADATEDRMGQMTYDNLFYNRVVKDVALMGFRAYGWTYGKYRSLIGGVADTLTTPARVARGEPVISDRMSYLIALPMVAAAIGGTMNYILTGEAPNDWRDLLMPRTGKFDANGNPQRISPPTYLKDFLSDWHDAPELKKMLGSFYHKLNPWISVAVDITRNSDFYNTKIFNEDDPWLKQQADRIGYLLKSATPFSVTGAIRLSESRGGISDYILPFFGFVPTKTVLTMTPAQNRAVELFRATLPAGSRTQEQAEHSKLLSQIIRDMRERNPTSADTAFLPNDPKRILSGLRTTPFQYQVSKLGLADAMRVWDLANDQERDQLRLIILKKFGTSKTVSQDEKLTYWRAFNAEAAE